jgi:hypothetical protein
MSDYSEVNFETADLIARDAIEDISPENIDSPAIRRLIEDLQEKSVNPVSPQLYNRTHNRHNRGR